MTSDAVQGTLVVVGAGGFGREVAWLARSASPGSDVVLAVTDPRYLPDAPSGTTLVEHLPSGLPFVCAMGDPTARRATVDTCLSHGLVATSLVHPQVDLSGDNTIGTGAVITAGVIVTTGITIGEHVHLNLGTTIGHDVVVGDYVTTAPGVHVSGHVRIEDGAYLGTGAVVINGSPHDPLVIGAGAFVAAGACVTRHVEPTALVAGVPAVRKR